MIGAMYTSRYVLPSYSRCESRHCRPEQLYVNENDQGNAMHYMAGSHALELQFDVRCACLHTSVSAWSSITRTVTRRGIRVCFQENVEKAEALGRNATVWHRMLTKRLAYVRDILHAT